MGSSLSSLTLMHALPRQPPQWKNACLSLFQALIILLQGRFLLPEPFLFPQTHSDVCHHQLKTPCFSYVLCDNNFPQNQRPKPRNVDYYFVMLCFGCSGLLASVGLATRCSASGGCSILTGARATRIQRPLDFYTCSKLQGPQSSHTGNKLWCMSTLF